MRYVSGVTFPQYFALQRGASVLRRARELAPPAPARKENRSRARRQRRKQARASPDGPLPRAASCLAKTQQTDERWRMRVPRRARLRQGLTLRFP